MTKPLIELTEDQIVEVEKLSAVLTTAQIADYLGISHVTFKAIRDRDDKVSFAYKGGKARAIAKIGGNLITQASEGNVAAQVFYLKTQAGWRETQEISIDSDNVQPMNFSFSVLPAVSDVVVTKGQTSDGA